MTASTLNRSYVPRRHPPRAQISTSLARVGAWVGLLSWAIFALTPIVWLLLAVTKTNSQIENGAPFAFGSLHNIPAAWHNLATFDQGAITEWIWNSVVLSVAAIVLTVVTTIPAGYALGTCQFRMRKPLLVASLMLMLMPGAALVLPLFLEMTEFGLVGNRLSVILPMSVFPFGVYLSFIYFSTAVSRDIYDAARLDGCSEWQVFLRLALPLSRPITALVTFFAFMRNWNDFFLPYVMLGSSQYPLPVGLATLAGATPELNPTSAASSNVGLPEVLLCALISMAPVMVALIIAQRTVLRSADLLGGGLRG